MMFSKKVCIYIIISIINLSFIPKIWSQTWVQVTTEGAIPLTQAGHTSVYDALNNRAIIFGGFGNNSSQHDVWVINNTNGLGGIPEWSLITVSGNSPEIRGYSTAVYDSNHNRMIIFGGSNYTTCGMNDVWVLCNANGSGGIPCWIELTTSGNIPGTRGTHSAVYDNENNRMIIFGGHDCRKGIVYDDVWVLDHANGLDGRPTWCELSTTGSKPTKRSQHSAVYDYIHNRMIVFGGWNGERNNEVWVLEHANGLGGPPAWIQLLPTEVIPTSRSFHSAEYDAEYNQIFIYGGTNHLNNKFNYLNEAWILHGANGLEGNPTWTQLTTTKPMPEGTMQHTAIYDQIHHRITIFGGINCDKMNTVWILQDVIGTSPLSETMSTNSK